MRAAVMHGAGDVRIENVPDARLMQPTDALVRVTRACVCGSDLWPYNALEPSETGRPMGHEAIGVDDAAGAEVHTMKDEAVCVPQADGTVVVLPIDEDDALMPSLPTLSDVMGTGHHSRRADHHPGPASRPDRAGQGVRRNRRSARTRRRGGRAGRQAHRRLRRPLPAGVRRPRTFDAHRAEHRASGGRGRPSRRAQDEKMPDHGWPMTLIASRPHRTATAAEMEARR
jgi:Alcohol dehydrogenase GroES-like domain